MKENFLRRTLRAVTGLKSRKAFALPYILFMAVFVVLPIILVLVYAFLNVDADKTLHFTLDNFGKIFRGEIPFFKVLWLSLYIGFINSALCLLLGYPIAYFLSQSKYNKSTITYMLFILPIWLNFLLRTLATQSILSAMGIELGGMGPVIFGMVYNFLPFMIIPIYNVLSKMDKNLIEAAADLGANDRQVFTKTIIPLSMPGVISGVIMVFMPSISTFVISQLLSDNKIQLLGNLIDFWATTGGSFYMACALSVILLVIVGLTMLLSNKFDKLGESKGEGLW